MLTTEEYERLRAPLLKMLAEAQEQHMRNTEPIRDELRKLLAVYIPPYYVPAVIFDPSTLSDEALAAIVKQANNQVAGMAAAPTNDPMGPTPRVTSLPDPPGGHWTTPAVLDALGLTDAELACASPTKACAGLSRTAHPFCGYDTGCPFCG